MDGWMDCGQCNAIQDTVAVDQQPRVGMIVCVWVRIWQQQKLADKSDERDSSACRNNRESGGVGVVADHRPPTETGTKDRQDCVNNNNHGCRAKNTKSFFGSVDSFFFQRTREFVDESNLHVLITQYTLSLVSFDSLRNESTTRFSFSISSPWPTQRDLPMKSCRGCCLQMWAARQVVGNDRPF